MTTSDHLKHLAALAPDLPLGQAVPVLEWIDGLLGLAQAAAATPTQPSIEGDGEQTPSPYGGGHRHG